MNATEIATVKAGALAEAQGAADAAALEAVRIKWLGRNGQLPEVMKGLKDMAPDERREAGRVANELKNELTAKLDERKAAFEAATARTSASAFDATLPGRWRATGSLHPITQVIERATAIFRTMGFTVASGPDIETVFNNFTALNTPESHPSRSPSDTFYLKDDQILRTQTSPVQIRVMLNQKPPIRIIAPGRCYRRDTTDATHSASFHQIEGLYVDRQVSLADLKGDVSHFAKQMMGPDVKVRFRPHFFPFTEPSVEYDFSCHVCGGKGCRVCKQSGWIEISGAGLVNPRVFEQVGIDASEWQGYAFGMGVERIAMILFGIGDIRNLYENDARFLAQFA
jgi:phenylalanyl-tRNA synthetase alpha chain